MTDTKHDPTHKTEATKSPDLKAPDFKLHRDEPEASFDAPIKKKLPEKHEAPQHRHLTTTKKERYSDDNGLPQVRELEARTPQYRFDCPACVAADEQRRHDRSYRVPDDELIRTLFLIPAGEPDAEVCKEYVARKYPTALNRTGTKFNWRSIVSYPRAQIVVVTRRVRPDQPSLLPLFKSEFRAADDKWLDVRQPTEALLPDVLESLPVLVEDAIQQREPSLLTERPMDTSELIDRLADLAHGYVIMKLNAPDEMVTLSQY